MTTTANSFNAVERIERLPLTNYQIKIFSIIGLAWFFDVVDVSMMTYALAAIKEHFQLDTVLAGVLGSSSFAGMFFGATLGGLLGDKFGRKKTLQLSIIIWGLASFLCALAPNILYLLIFRILLGLGMGMEMPAAQTLACELTATKYRGRCMAALQGLIPLGAISAGIIAFLVLPHFGWRGLFVVQGLSAGIVIAVRKFIPESPRWLEQAGKMDKANDILIAFETGVSIALKGKILPEVQTIQSSNSPNTLTKSHHRLLSICSSIYKKRTAMLGITWFLISISYYGTKIWITTLLHTKGYSIINANLYLLIMSLAGIPGFLTAMYLVEKWGRKSTLIATLAGMAFSFCLFAGAANTTQIIAYGLIMQYFMFAMWCPLYLYTAELYPTNTRATGSGCSNGFGRLGAMFGPGMVGIILMQFPQINVFYLGAVMLATATLVVAVWGEETKGHLLESISPQI